MGIHTLQHKEAQPYYNVMVQDGSLRYAAQENLQPVEQKVRIQHPLVGKHFESFVNEKYIMNSELKARYPMG